MCKSDQLCCLPESSVAVHILASILMSIHHLSLSLSLNPGDALVIINRNAIVSNNLRGCAVLEDKAKFALLSPPGSLETAVVSGAEGVKIWSSQRWGSGSSSLHHSPQLQEDDKKKDNGDDWWCVKASKGNGGFDVFVLHRQNIHSVLNR